jgi:hypothetical protein
VLGPGGGSGFREPHETRRVRQAHGLPNAIVGVPLEEPPRHFLEPTPIESVKVELFR